MINNQFIYSEVKLKETGGIWYIDLQLLHEFVYFFAYFYFIFNVIFIVIFFSVGGTFKRRTHTGTVSYIPILINLLTGVKAQEAGGICYI